MLQIKRIPFVASFALVLLLAFARSASAAAPANDNFADAQLLTAGAPAVTGNSFEGTFESGEPNAGDTFGGSIWYRLDVPSGGVAVFTVCSTFDVSQPVPAAGFTGTSLATLYRPYAPGPFAACDEPLLVQANAAGPVYLQLGESSWDFTVSASFHAAPANDNFASAQTINGSNASVAVDNTWATLEPGENANPQYDTHSLWFKWTAPLDGTINSSACVPLPNTADVNNTLSLYTGSALGSLTELATNDNACAGDGGLISGIAVTQGTTYYLRISSHFHDMFFGASTFLFSFFTTPANGNLADAIDLGSASSFSTLATNTEVTDAPEAGEPAIGGAQRYKSVWFKWTAPVSGQFRFDQCEEESFSGDIVLGAFTSSAGANPAPSDLVAAPNLLPNMGDQNCNQMSVINQAGWITIDVTAGTTYWIAVANYNAAENGRVFSLRATNVTLAATEEPKLTGKALIGSQLNVTAGIWSGGGALDPTEISYQWQVCVSDQEGSDDCVDVPSSGNDSWYTIPPDYFDYAFRVLVTAANDVSSVVYTSPRTGLADHDSDDDGIGDAADLCEGQDNEAPKTNGCPITPLIVSGVPSVTGKAALGETLTLNLGTASNGSAIDPTTPAPSVTYSWKACASPGEGAPCTPRSPGGLAYSPTAADAGLWIGARVTWTNGDQTESFWAGAPSAVAVDPAGLPKVGKSLGTLKVGKGKLSVKKLRFICAAHATSNCAGLATLTGKFGKKKFSIKAKIVVRPGKSSVLVFKFSKSQLKALKKAKKAKASISLTFGSAGYPAAKLKTTLTLKP